jgi:phenylalanyl-tRNA synthetase beta chain
MLKILGKNDKIIEVANPLSVENSALQNSLIPNLIQNTEDNLRYFEEFKIFELARVYCLSSFAASVSPKGSPAAMADKLPYQPKILAGVVVTQKDKNALLELKGALEGLLNKLQVTNYELRVTKQECDYLDNEKFLSIEISGKELGWFSELKESVYNQFNFKKRKVALFEINFDKLVLAARESESVKYAPLPQFPSIVRDLAFEVSWDIKWNDIKNEILRRFTPQDDNLREVQFLSEFGLGDRKSVAFRIVYQADRTLKEEEVEVVENKIVEMISKKFNARLRAALGK